MINMRISLNKIVRRNEIVAVCNRKYRVRVRLGGKKEGLELAFGKYLI